ncbi:FecR domain-containing protein [Niabella sp. CC-SYL272]|uniref:FecR domain-containing protein n=1 Tax=Niabella agricola TaxID=2891571 RepID=UPI001F43F072|nr:FecR domain-containing protein [Niabella agricola]MCF3108651.1 FecR domain-containing protein [Niabella agricola]
MEHKLIAYHEQLLDASERKAVEQWLRQDPAHQGIYDKTIRIWEQSRNPLAYTYYNKERAWDKIQAQIDQVPAAAGRGRFAALKWWQVAAVAASLAGIVLFFLVWLRPEPRVYIADAGTRELHLKDNSTIELYANGVLEVDRAFNRKTRTVTLKGDARFDIARNPDKPFIIHNKKMEVQVLGTAFTIQQRMAFNTVYVHSGKVKATLGNQTVTAVAGQKIVQDNKTRQLLLREIQTPIESVLKTQTIRCNNMRIDSLANILRELYNVDVQFDPAIGSKRITSTYLSYESPEQVMENIALMINATWRKQGDHYIITK